MNIKLVIPRYQADISWLNDVTVPVEMSSAGPNIGRCCLFKLQFLIANYENLPDTIVFLQDNPFDHLNCACHGKVDLFEKIEYLTNNPVDYWEFPKHHFTTDFNGCPRHSELPVGKIYSQLLTGSLPLIHQCTGRCMFAVSKSRVLRRAKAFYERMLDLIHSEPKAPWCFERLWNLIFHDNHIPSYEEI